MDPKQLFTTAVAAADCCIHIIREEKLGDATPCTEWDVRALLNHMTSELLWVPAMLAGKTVGQVGTAYDGDVLGQDFRAAWRAALTKARAAVLAADPEAVVHASFADIKASEYITQVAGDIYVHGWDADQAVKCSLRFDPAAAQALYQYYSAQAGVWREAGLIGQEVAVPSDASFAERLLGLLGRQPHPAVVAA